MRNVHELAWTSASLFSPSGSFLRTDIDRIDRDLRWSSKFHLHYELSTYWWNDRFQIHSNLYYKYSHRHVDQASAPMGDRCRIRSLCVSSDTVREWIHEGSLRNICPSLSQWSNLIEWTEKKCFTVEKKKKSEFAYIRIGIAILWSRFEFQWLVLEDLN